MVTVVKEVEKEFFKMVMAATTLSVSKDNPTLVVEMSSWLQQFRLLGSSGLATIFLNQTLLADNKDPFKRAYTYIKVLKEEMYKISNTLNQNPYQLGVKTGS